VLWNETWYGVAAINLTENINPEICILSADINKECFLLGIEQSNAHACHPFLSANP
jgi:hypothetical protein